MIVSTSDKEPAIGNTLNTPGWPGVRRWVTLHWCGRLSVTRTVLISACLSFVPMMILGLLAFLLSVFLGPETRLVERLFYLGVGSLLLALFWWVWGTYQKSLRLLEDGRWIAAFTTYLVAIAGSALLYFMAIDAFRTIAGPRDGYARMMAACERSDSKWINRPWSVRADRELNRIVVSGDIGWGSAQALKEVVERNPHLRLIQLESYGGLVHEKNLMIELVEKYELDTLVNSRCVSACTGVFLAGKRRFVTPNARFGFHRAGYCGMRRDEPWLVSDHMTAIYYRERGVEEEFLKRAMETRYDDLWIVTALELKRGNFATHWWSDRPAEYSRSSQNH